MSGSTSLIYYLVFDQTSLQVTTFGAITPTMYGSIAAAANAVQITKTNYDLLSAGGSYLWVNNQLVIVPRGVLDLKSARMGAAAIIDAQAEQARLQYISPGFGMMLTYGEKTREAREFLAAYPTDADYAAASPAPTAADYPLIFGEVGITAPDAWGVATVFINRFNQWVIIGAEIERQRLTAKAALADTSTIQEIAALTNVPWPISSNLAVLAGATLNAAGGPEVTGALAAVAGAYS